jgi:hypothetical protein
VLRKVDTTQVPLSAYLGAVGMPGVTAWVGLTQIIEPKAGETVVVSAASGAVGSAVGQLAKARGCRVVGIAGGPEKCAYVTDELGFDACIDHKAQRDLKSLSQALKAACPDGIDGYFENVGGLILDAVMLRMNAFGRIALCGMIAGYNGEPIPMANPQLILVSRLKLQGFIVSEHMALWPQALKELGQRVVRQRAEVPREHRARPGRRARGLPRPAQGAQLRQAARQAGLNWLDLDALRDPGRDDLYDALALRCRVFVLEQGPYLDPDGLDRVAWHLLGRDASGALHAYLRVVDPG